MRISSQLAAQAAFSRLQSTGPQCWREIYSWCNSIMASFRSK